MPSWLGKFTSKKAKKEKKVKIFDMFQRKLKCSSEEKFNDKSRGSKRYDADTISKKEYQPPVPSRSLSLSPSRLILCCKRFSENPNATSVVGGATGSKPLHVSNSEEPTSGDGDIGNASISSDGNYSDIIIEDPLALMVDPLNPLAPDFENGNNATMNSSRVQSGENTPLNPLVTLNSLLFPSASSSSVETSSPSSPASEILIDPLNFKKGKFLGRGSFGQVFLGFNRDSGMMCAMKEVTLCPDDEKSMESAKQLRQEIALLSHLRHPHIIHYYGSETVDDKLYIFLEYAAGGSLNKLLREYDQLGEDAIRFYTAQILSGLSYLHGKGIVHRDIKGANILMDPNGTLKLADFGTAKYIKGESSPFSLNGSPHWMAPEVIKNPGACDLSVDIWSLGCTILEMATTKPPWSKFEGVAVMYKLGNTDEVPKIPKYLSKQGRDFLRLCLQRDPKDRPSAAELLLHPFVKDIIVETNIMVNIIGVSIKLLILYSFMQQNLSLIHIDLLLLHAEIR
ncbi:PREDICTED: mitogen-activated protein kinase kinase kinase YODA-like [Lupinus angustifolius]|uniref:mitogen-activated protein kinase kinase kinase YODA-like n=1 Tax=Lupinus angustifolius TaxID=3871 RepID=UPI00092F95B4|nr:PREDICTED: mitogen-activated protein kinase kinase kinase YODA-like [Lupinus angustifolius]